MKQWHTLLIAAVTTAAAVTALGVAVDYVMKPTPYANADYVLVDDGESCVYANREEDRAGREVTVFRAYSADAFDGPCPHHAESPVAHGEGVNLPPLQQEQTGET